ncbi:hypothetical protein HYALB_00000628 [Hymenoscyphus albidus]|uniref:SRR1-like domain-containing protein n=1 Tax=Hymenoscyphus albidus TaxID=595503 RepID=A0A9N9QCS7_9HELO|nr:hypothetical protein HYALB_00000628 [Hymenoscyphus albidus]
MEGSYTQIPTEVIDRNPPPSDLRIEPLEPSEDNSDPKREIEVIKRMNFHCVQLGNYRKHGDSRAVDQNFYKDQKVQLPPMKDEATAAERKAMLEDLKEKCKKILWDHENLPTEFFKEPPGSMKDSVTSDAKIEEEIRKYSGSKFLREFRETIRNKKDSLTGVTKIFALGGGTLTNIAPLSLLSCIQHAELLAIRDILDPDGTKIEIIIQDPMYTNRDKHMAKTLGMRVVEDKYNEHESWFNIDGSTLVVDLILPVAVKKYLVEIFKPLAFLGEEMDPFLFREGTPSISSIKMETFILSPERATFTDYLLRPKYTLEMFNKEYEATKMNIDGMDFGVKREFKWANDGFNGGSFMGNAPHLYIRKSSSK